MGHDFARAWVSAFALLCAWALAPSWAYAQAVPGPADAGRVQQRLPDMLPLPETPGGAPRALGPQLTAPEEARAIQFVLRRVVIEGATAFSEKQLADIYRDDLGEEISLHRVWAYAGRITERYQQAGYFLSRAYIPAQEIADGVVHIRVVEGFVHTLELDAKARANPLVVQWTQRLQAQKPLTVDAMESLLLRLNDLPGQNYRAVLQKNEVSDAPEGAAQLNVVTTEEPKEIHLNVDNFGSRYLGPYEASAQVMLPIIPNQRTMVSVLASTPADELKYGSITHTIPLSYDWSMDLNAGRTDTHPGSVLKTQEIDSVSTSFGFGFTYQWMRQRRENLTSRLAFDGRNTDSDIAKLLPLTRDQVRAVRFSSTYQRMADSGSYDYATLIATQGVDGLGASKANDSNLSRAEATPDFQKLEFLYSRLQPLPGDFAGIVSVSGQIASGPLYSSEEFGYGGQNFGRAYDASEITGDHGIAASLEIRYHGLKPWGGMKLAPYGFYDIGRVYNDDAGQEKQASGSSAGFGLRVATEQGISANIGMAFPLTREIDQPLYGNEKSPRYMLQIGYDF